MEYQYKDHLIFNDIIIIKPQYDDIDFSFIKNNIKYLLFFNERNDIIEENRYYNYRDNLPLSISVFNKSVDNLPNNLTHIIFGYCFDQSVDNLPNKLTHLTFGFRFNKNVDNLPNKLTHLTFGFWFNCTVNNLPQSITHISFGSKFNRNYVL